MRGSHCLMVRVLMVKRDYLIDPLFRRIEDSFVDRARKLMCRVDFLGKFNQVLDLIITFILIIQT